MSPLYYNAKYVITADLTELEEVKEEMSPFELILTTAKALGGGAVEKLEETVRELEWNVEKLRANTVSLCDCITFALDQVGNAGEQVQDVSPELLDKVIDDYQKHQQEKQRMTHMQTIADFGLTDDGKGRTKYPLFVEIIPELNDLLTKKKFRTVVFTPPPNIAWGDDAKKFAFKMLHTKKPYRFRPLRDGSAEVECKRLVSRQDLVKLESLLPGESQDGYMHASQFTVHSCLEALLISMNKMWEDIEVQQNSKERVLMLPMFQKLVGGRLPVKKLRKVYEELEVISAEVDSVPNGGI